MEENTPIEQLETRFLNHEQDLLALSKSGSAPSREPPRLLNMKLAVAVLCILVLLPLSVLTVVAGFFARVAVFILVGLFCVAIGSSMGLASNVDMPLRDLATCVSM
jgi:hypothetical protein